MSRERFKIMLEFSRFDKKYTQYTRQGLTNKTVMSNFEYHCHAILPTIVMQRSDYRCQKKESYFLSSMHMSIEIVETQSVKPEIINYNRIKCYASTLRNDESAVAAGIKRNLQYD